METIKIKNKEYEIKENEDKSLTLTEIKKNEIKKVKTSPDFNELYYFINDNENVVVGCFNSNIDAKRWVAGNGFFTQEEAEKELERRKVFQLLKDFKLKNDNGELDWENFKQKKWAIVIDGCEKNKVYCTHTCTIRDLNTIYFSSKDILDQAIYKIGEKRIYNAFK